MDIARAFEGWFDGGGATSFEVERARSRARAPFARRDDAETGFSLALDRGRRRRARRVVV